MCASDRSLGGTGTLLNNAARAREGRDPYPVPVDEGANVCNKRVCVSVSVSVSVRRGRMACMNRRGKDGGIYIKGRKEGVWYRYISDRKEGLWYNCMERKDCDMSVWKHCPRGLHMHHQRSHRCQTRCSHDSRKTDHHAASPESII